MFAHRPKSLSFPAGSAGESLLSYGVAGAAGKQQVPFDFAHGRLSQLRCSE